MGKTSLVSKYCQGSFKERERATEQAAFNKKRILVGNVQVELGIWDTAGQERFHSIQPLYYRDANAVRASPCLFLPLRSRAAERAPPLSKAWSLRRCSSST